MGLAGLCHRPFGEGCTAQNAGDTGVALLLSLALPRSGRSTPGSPSSCWAPEWSSSASCPAQNSRLALASLPQPDLEVRSLRNAARQYPCARPSVLSPRAPSITLYRGPCDEGLDQEHARAAARRDRR